MATTHVLIVDSNTFRYHLEYMFVGTGAKDYTIDFNNKATSRLSPTRENLLVSMIADMKRVKKDDYIIFYLQQNKFVKEGLFFGIFKVKEIDTDCKDPCFLDNSNPQYLFLDLTKSLPFRILIEPYKVYQNGVTEWEALDEIRTIHCPNQMLWSLIYRKLKGNRGNTMITLYESERLFKLIRDKNASNYLRGSNFTFDLTNNKIIVNTKTPVNYAGKKECINVLPRLIGKYCEGKTGFETHLQAYLLEDIYRLPLFESKDHILEWLGNEVSCGVGMQRIDILASFKNNEISNLFAIELKSVEAEETITNQLQRYVDWLNQYYIPNKPSDIKPVIVAKEYNNKLSSRYSNLINSLRTFNSKNSLKVRYIEFSIDCNSNSITFEEVSY